MLLLVKLAPKAGASNKLQPAVYQRRCPNWVLFSKPFILMGPQFKTPKYAFSVWNVLSFFQDVKFLSCLHVREVAGLIKVWYFRVLWARTRHWSRVRCVGCDPAQCPISSSRVEAIHPGWGIVGLFSFFKKMWHFRFPPQSREYLCKLFWSHLELGESLDFLWKWALCQVWIGRFASGLWLEVHSFLWVLGMCVSGDELASELRRAGRTYLYPRSPLA